MLHTFNQYANNYKINYIIYKQVYNTKYCNENNQKRFKISDSFQNLQNIFQILITLIRSILKGIQQFFSC